MKPARGIRVLRQILKIELLINMRSKWIVGFSVAFALLAMGISYFGLALIGYEVEFQDFYRTVASLLNLVIYIVPIVALVIGANSFSVERGDLDMLLSQPVSRTQVLLGKMGGLFGTVVLSTLIGFGIAGVIIALKCGYEGAWKYLIFVALCIGMGTVFLSLAALISVLARRRAKALVVTLLLWAFFVIFYDLVVIALSYYVEEAYVRPLLYFSLLANPVDIVRVLTLMVIGGIAALGPAGAGMLRQFGGLWTSLILSLAMLVVWIIIPLAGAVLVFKRQDIL